MLMKEICLLWSKGVFKVYDESCRKAMKLQHTWWDALAKQCLYFDNGKPEKRIRSKDMGFLVKPQEIVMLIRGGNTGK